MREGAVEREFTCIVCPIGCRLSVSGEGSSLVVSGNRCARGKTYALAEISAPLRVVTALVRLKEPMRECAAGEGGRWAAWAPRMASVRTTAGFPRERIGELLEVLRSMRLDLPVELGQVVLADALGTGVDVVATRSICVG